MSSSEIDPSALLSAERHALNGHHPFQSTNFLAFVPTQAISVFDKTFLRSPSKITNCYDDTMTEMT